MDDIDKIDKVFERLNQIEKLYGLTGVFIAILIVIGFILIWKYLTKTIENQAKITFDKELADHNKKIQKELTLLTNELQLIANKQLGNIDKEREAIINYLNAYSYWLYGSLNVDILSFKYNNYEDINSVLRTIRKANADCNEAWNKLKFWSTDKALITTSHDLNQAILKYSQYHQKTLGGLRHNLSWGKIYSDQFQTIIGQIKQYKEWAEFLASEDKRIREENEKTVKEFWDGQLALFKEVVRQNEIFQETARKYLNHGE
ncbi:MAG: hypothetical protein ACK498_17110 [Cyclobacteriaceae bacterium]|jgi:hypothetical protein